MTSHKKIMEEVNRMRKIAYKGTDAEKQAYSNAVLSNGITIMDLYVASEMGYDVEGHIRKFLNSSEDGLVELALEYCCENKFLDEKTKYDLAIELYEKVLSFGSYPTMIKATKLLEQDALFSEYLKGKPDSNYYASIHNKMVREYGQELIREQMFGRKK